MHQYNRAEHHICSNCFRHKVDRQYIVDSAMRRVSIVCCGCGNSTIGLAVRGTMTASGNAHGYRTGCNLTAGVAVGTEIA